MTRYIAILRGVNVSGHRIIKMDALKELLTEIGLKNPKTYIQSGNVVFQKEKEDVKEIAKKITEAIKNKFTHEVPVIVLEHQKLKSIIDQNPFVGDERIDQKFLHLTFLSENPEKILHKAIKELDCQEDVFELIGDVIYLYCPNGYRRTKLTNGFFESKLKAKATTRNWKTSKELLAMAELLA